MRISRALRSAEHLSAYSETGGFSTFSFRQRYTILLKNQTDPTIADFFYEQWLHASVGDAPSYNYWWVTSFAMGSMVGILSRHWFFNPDLYGRRQENKKPLPDLTGSGHTHSLITITACATCPTSTSGA